MQRNGRKNFIRAIEQISKGNQSAADVVAELGTMKDGGILPDSYPESAVLFFDVTSCKSK